MTSTRESRLLHIAGYLLAVAGFAVSLFLLHHALTHGSLAGCGPGSGCDQVLNSRWSRWFVYPVSLFAATAYAVVLAMLPFTHQRLAQRTQRFAWLVMLIIGTCLIVAAAWFIFLQAVIISAWCAWCTIAHVIGLLLAMLIFRGGYLAFQAAVLTRATLVKATLIAVVPLMVLFIGQWQATAYQLQTFDLDFDNLASKQPDEPRRIGVFSVATEVGDLSVQIELDPREFVILGDADAPFVLVYLYDYACGYCRIMHHHLQQARAQLGRSLTIVKLPAPLESWHDSQPTDPPRQQGLALYARLALAIWFARPQQFEPFDDWMMQQPMPLNPDAAYEKAAQLMGGVNELDKALMNPKIDNLLNRIERMQWQIQYPRVPALATPGGALFGGVEDRKVFFEILEHWNLKVEH